jgi:hypothetical protein
MRNSETKSRKKKILKHLGNVCMAVVWLTLMTSPISAALDPSDAASQVIGAEGGVKGSKAVLDAGMKLTKSKPAMTVATAIVCISCLPAAGLSASPALCIACGILIAKTFG